MTQWGSETQFFEVPRRRFAAYPAGRREHLHPPLSHPDIPLWSGQRLGSLYKFALPTQMVSAKLCQQWAGFRAKYLLKSVLHLMISANMSGAPNLVSQDMAFV